MTPAPWSPLLPRSRCFDDLVAKSYLTLATSWTVAHQAPLSMEFPRQEYRSGLPFPSPDIFLTQGSNPGLLCCRWSPVLEADSLLTEPPAKPSNDFVPQLILLDCSFLLLPTLLNLLSFFFFFKIYLMGGELEAVDWRWCLSFLIVIIFLFSCSRCQLWHTWSPVFVAVYGSFSCGIRTFSCSMWDLVTWPGIKPGPPALGL